MDQMKKQTILKFLLIMWVSTTLLTSCDPGIDLSKTDTTVLIDQSLVMPVGELNVSIQDLLKQFNFENSLGSDPDSILFETNITKEYSVPPMDLLKNAVPFTKSFPLNVNFPTPVPANFEIPPAVLGSTNFEIDLGYNKNTDERMDSIVVNLVTLGVKIKDVTGIKNAITGEDIQPYDLNVTLIFSKIKNGKGTIIIPTNGSFGQIHNIDITNFVMDTHGSAGMPMQILFTTGSNPLIINPSANIGFELNVNALNFNAAYGKFILSGLASRTLTMPLDMLSNIPKGLHFADPRATISIKSNMGSKLQFNIDYVKAFSKNNSTTTVFASFENGSRSTTETLVNRATYPRDTVSNTMKTLDKTYGQTNKLFDTSVQQDSLQYKFSVQTDNTDPLPMFVIPNMYMKATVKVQVPLQLQAGSSFEMKDSITIKGDSISFGSIDSCFLMLDVINKIPARVALIASFPETTLPDQTYYIEAPKLNDIGLVLGLNEIGHIFTSQNIKVKLTKAQTEQLKSAKKMVYTLRFIGEDMNKTPKLMYFEKKNSFNVKLGFYVKANYNFNLLK